MHQLILALRVLESGLHAPCLEGLAVADRADFAVGFLRGQPHFQIIGFGSAKAHIAGGQQHHAVWQAELLQHLLGVAGHLLQRLVAALGVHHLHHLHLVELVLADHAAGVTAIAAGFGAKAWAVRRELDGQLVFGQHGVAHQVGQRHFSRGDQVQRRMVGHWLGVLPAFVGCEQIALELGQLARALERFGVDDIGHIALGVAMLASLQVEHELRQRPVQARDLVLHDRETRTGDLRASVEVQPQRRAHVHMVLHLEVELARPFAIGTPCAHLDVGRLVGPHRDTLVRQVGHCRQHGCQLSLNLLQPRSRTI